MLEAGRPGSIRRSCYDLDRTSFNEQRLSMNQGVGNFSVSRFENPAESLAGNIHSFRSIGLVKSLQVRQANGFKLIDR